MKSAEAALRRIDWTGATVDHEPCRVSIVHSVRFSSELSKKLEAEADRRGVTPNVLIHDLISVGLAEAH
jgi:hypothetical protein